MDKDRDAPVKPLDLDKFIEQSAKSFIAWLLDKSKPQPWADKK